jgi:hypothetical protein
MEIVLDFAPSSNGFTESHQMLIMPIVGQRLSKHATVKHYKKSSPDSPTLNDRRSNLVNNPILKWNSPR